MDNLISQARSFMNNSSGGGSGGSGSFDFESILSHAQSFSGSSSGSGGGSSELFSQATKYLSNNSSNIQQDAQNVDESSLQQTSDDVQNSDGSNHSSEIGQAAAVSAIKDYLSGKGNTGGSSGQSTQEKIMALAMSHASSLYSQKSSNGQVSGGDEQNAVNSASETVMKLLVKHEGVSGMAKMFL